MNLVKGIIPPLVTPLLDDGTLDLNGLERLIEYQISGGVHGLFLLGTTGEGPSLKYSLRVELIKEVCNQVGGRIPVLVGITDSSFKESVYLAEKSSEYGADAVVLAPPFYFQISQTELYNYTHQLLNELPLPVFLYNQPSLTKLNLGLEIVEDLLKRPEVIGFKDSSGDLVYFHKLKKMTDDAGIPLFVGPEELLMESLVMGGSGGVSGGANIFPELYVSLYEAINAGDVERGLTLHNKIMQLSEVVYSGSAYGSSSIINGIKKALSYLNICNAHLAKPLGNISMEKAARVEQYISEFKSSTLWVKDGL